MEKVRMYVKLFKENFKNCGNIDCGFLIVDVEPPHITLKLCKKHEHEVRHDRDIHAHISPIIDKPQTFESLHLADISSESFN